MTFLALSNINTSLVYTAIFLAVSFCAIFCQRITKNINGVMVITNKGLYCFAIAIMMIFTIIIANGADYNMYIRIYNGTTVDSLLDYQVEFGYELLNMFLRLIIPDARIGIAIIKFITIFLFASALYSMRNYMYIGVGLIAYMALSYYSSFCLIRLYLASAIVFCGIAVIIRNKKRKYFKFALSILFAASIHYTAIANITLLFLFWLFDKGIKNETFNRKIIALIILAFLGSILSAVLIPVLVNNVSFLEKYKVYLQSSNGFGIGQFLFLLPPTFLVYDANSTVKEIKNTKVDLYVVISLVVSVTIIMMGYVIGMLARLEAFFNLPYYICTGYALMTIDKWNKQYNKNQDSIIIFYKFFIFLYFTFRFILFITNAMAESGITELIFIWNINV